MSFAGLARITNEMGGQNEKIERNDDKVAAWTYVVSLKTQIPYKPLKNGE